MISVFFLHTTVQGSFVKFIQTVDKVTSLVLNVRYTLFISDCQADTDFSTLGSPWMVFELLFTIFHFVVNVLDMAPKPRLTKSDLTTTDTFLF